MSSIFERLKNDAMQQLPDALRKAKSEKGRSRLLGYEFDQSVREALHKAMEPIFFDIIREMPSFLYGDVENAHNTTPYNLIRDAITDAAVYEMRKDLQKVRIEDFGKVGSKELALVMQNVIEVAGKLEHSLHLKDTVPELLADARSSVEKWRDDRTQENFAALCDSAYSLIHVLMAARVSREANTARPLRELMDFAAEHPRFFVKKGTAPRNGR